MPELPEVETVRCGLEGALKGATIAKVALRRKDLRIPFPKDIGSLLAGRTITQISRRAKYLLFSFDGPDVMIAHLGMSGRFSVIASEPASYQLHDHFILHLTDGRVVIYNDARRFGLITLAKTDVLAAHPLLAALGPEPLDKEFSATYLKKQLLRHKAAVKGVLMDQGVVVGVGNIYASEALYLCGIDPSKPAAEAASSAGTIVQSIRHVLKDAIASGGSSLRDFIHVSGESGYFQHHFNVYGREGEPCFQCHTPIRRIRTAGRSTFFCSNCQI